MTPSEELAKLTPEAAPDRMAGFVERVFPDWSAAFKWAIECDLGVPWPYLSYSSDEYHFLFRIDTHESWRGTESLYHLMIQLNAEYWEQRK